MLMRRGVGGRNRSTYKAVLELDNVPMTAGFKDVDFTLEIF
jgi:hypothetical protein